MLKYVLTGAAAALAMTAWALSPQAGAAEKGTMAKDISAIEKAVHANPFRTAKEMARDKYRNPHKTLEFFGVEPSMTVVEVGPGGGWYTSILAPLTAREGKYIAVSAAPTESTPDRFRTRTMEWRENFIDDSGKFGKNASARFMMQPAPFTMEDSVDAALIFRGMHGVINWGTAKPMLAELFKVMKPGGVLGIVQHRDNEDSANNPEEKMIGYVKQSYVIDLVESAGFALEATSEINANPKDSKDWKRGVWTLPPRLINDEKDKEKYLAVGESDRMTLKFVKPAA